MKNNRLYRGCFTILVLALLVLSGCTTTSKDLYSSQITLYVEITGLLIGSAPMNYTLFISDSPQVVGKNPVSSSDLFPEHANYPTYRRVGHIEQQGQKLDEVSVTGKKFLKAYDITEFVRAHPARRYFFAIEKKSDSIFVPVEVWVNILSPDGRIVKTNRVIYDYGFDESKPALEFSIYINS